jgi:hypothetical protein
MEKERLIMQELSDRKAYNLARKQQLHIDSKKQLDEQVLLKEVANFNNLLASETQ